MNSELRGKKKIFILHGWAYSLEKWEPFIEELKRNHFEPVLLKIPGLTAPLNEVWTVDNYVEWLKKNVEKEKGEIILLGHSNGGRISLAFALAYPEKVAKLFLIDSAGIYHNELSLRLKRLVFGRIAKLGKHIKNIQAVRKLFYRFVREHDYEKANPMLRQTMRNLIANDLTPDLKNVAIPTTIIWGENDKMTSVKDGKLMHQMINKSDFFLIKNARHSPQFTNVKEVAQIIYDSL